MFDALPGAAEVQQRFLEAALVPDVRAAKAELERLVRIGASPRAVDLHVLEPVLVEVGRRWERAEVGIAHEHLVTAVTRSAMAMLAPRMRRGRRTGRRIVLTPVPPERHVVGIEMMTDFLDADGWDVVNLGVPMPAADLVSFVAEQRPDVVGLSTTLPSHLDETRDVVAELKRLPDAPLVMVGGQAYRGNHCLAMDVGADAFALDAEEASSYLRVRFATPAGDLESLTAMCDGSGR